MRISGFAMHDGEEWVCEGAIVLDMRKLLDHSSAGDANDVQREWKIEEIAPWTGGRRMTVTTRVLDQIGPQKVCHGWVD